MKLQVQQDEEPEINLTSLIDVVFLLLIFFMVSSTFERQTLLRVDLPEAAMAQSERVPDLVELIIDREGQYYISDRMLADDRKSTLQLAIREAFEERPDATLVIRADAEAHHRLVVRAMDAASAEGIVRLSIATVDEAGDES